MKTARHKLTLVLVLAAISLATVVQSAAAVDEFDRQWPQWRGPRATGVAPEGHPPINWSEEQNVRWKTEIPGLGHATPIVWKDQIFLLSAIPTTSEKDLLQEFGLFEEEAEHRFVILSLNRDDGRVRWQQTAQTKVPHEQGHQDATQASNSPVTDGEHLFAYFGSRGLFCYDLQGELIWERQLGQMRTRREFGEGSSPALFGNTIVVNWDHEGESFAIAFDKRTGEERWKVPRDEPTSWSTPLVVEVDGRPQVIISATHRIRSYDLHTGELIWSCDGMTVNTIPSPVSADGLVFLTSGFRGNAMRAIRLAGATGDLSASNAVVWRHDRDTPYVPSPLLYDNALYFLKRNNGILTRLQATTGAVDFGPERLPAVDGMYASPVGAGGHVYLPDRSGTTLVLKHDKTLEIVAANQLDEGFDASPAIVGNELYLRGRHHLYCIAEE